MPDLFGNIFSSPLLEQAVIDTLKKWLPTYLREVELQLGRNPGDIPSPRNYTTRNKFVKFPEDQLPTIVVISPGLAGDPSMEGDGSYRAKWSLGIGAIVSTSTEEGTNLVAKIYAAAIRSVLVQKASLGGIAVGVEWFDESYDDIPTEDTERTLGAATLYLRVEVENVTNRRQGPDTVFVPDPDATTPPGANWPDAETVTVELIKEAL